MRFEIPHCPECSRKAAYIWELVPVKQSILQDEEGEFDYHDCQEDPCWEGSEIEQDEDGMITLQCDAGHDWQTRFVDDASLSNPSTAEAEDGVGGECIDEQAEDDLDAAGLSPSS